MRKNKLEEEYEKLREDAERYWMLQKYAQCCSPHIDGTCNWRIMDLPLNNFRAKSLDDAVDMMIRDHERATRYDKT